MRTRNVAPTTYSEPMTSSPDFSLMTIQPFRTQLLKWVGNKQKMAHLIASELPPLRSGGTYFEPFLGSGAVLGTLQPSKALGSDGFGPLVGIWECLRSDPALLVEWYRERYERYSSAHDRVTAYEEIKASYNSEPNSADLVFLARSCYGGVVRFRKADGYMSTPCGVHQPIRPESFKDRVRIWHERTRGAVFRHLDFREAFNLVSEGDVVYCDPPYVDTQAILYGAQDFRLADLLVEIAAAKDRGAFVALSIDGSKKSGKHNVLLDIPEDLFEAELAVTVGRSMLRRFQKEGESLEDEVVKDRLLLTYDPTAITR